MATTGRRRVTFLDLMILVAATALGLALTQLAWPRDLANPGGTGSFFAGPILRPIPQGYRSKTWLLPVAERVVLLLPCLAAWTGGILAIRLVNPRPRWRRVARQPGSVAAVAVLAVLVCEAYLLLGGAWLDGRFGWSSRSSVANFATNGVVLLAHHAGWAVLVAWLALALTGRSRAEAGWVDRCGRALGLGWIVAGIAASLLVDQTPWWGTFISP